MEPSSYCRPRAGVKRQRGEIMKLPSGSLRVRVYAGVDPLTGKRHYLTETVPAGRTAEREAEKVRTRFLNQVDEKRSPRTRATLNQLLDRWLEVVDIEPTTRMGYENKLNKHVRPVLGKLPFGRLDAETLESFYATLRRCRDWCGGKAYVKHRVNGKHTCTAKCRSHVCKPLSGLISAADPLDPQWRTKPGCPMALDCRQPRRPGRATRTAAP